MYWLKYWLVAGVAVILQPIRIQNKSADTVGSKESKTKN
jgi:hypothetical protein